MSIEVDLEHIVNLLNVYEGLVLHEYMEQTQLNSLPVDSHSIFAEESIFEFGVGNKVQAVKRTIPCLSSNYLYIKSKFEDNIYCLKNFWYSDIYYLCQTIRANLFYNKPEEAAQNLEKIYKLFEIYAGVIDCMPVQGKTPQFVVLDYSLERQLTHLWLPKLSEHFSAHYPGAKTTPEKSSLQHILHRPHRQIFYKLLIKRVTETGKKWPSLNSIVTEMRQPFSRELKAVKNQNLKYLIDGRTLYIQTFEDMKKRIKEACINKPWLKSRTYAKTLGSYNAKSLLETLDILIQEQSDLRKKLKDDQKALKNPNQAFNYQFIVRDSYSQQTLLEWLSLYSLAMKSRIVSAANKSQYYYVGEHMLLDTISNYREFYKDKFCRYEWYETYFLI